MYFPSLNQTRHTYTSERPELKLTDKRAGERTSEGTRNKHSKERTNIFKYLNKLTKTNNLTKGQQSSQQTHK